MNTLKYNSIPTLCNIKIPPNFMKKQIQIKVKELSKTHPPRSTPKKEIFDVSTIIDIDEIGEKEVITKSVKYETD